MHAQPRLASGPERLLVWAAVLIVLGFVAVPVGAIFAFALAEGFAPVVRVLGRADVHAALRLSAFAVLVAVPCVTLFGTAAAWVVTRTDLPGRGALSALLHLPLAVPPVVSGLLVVLTLGPRSPIGHALLVRGYPVVFAPPAIVLATALVSLGVVARDLLPVMESVGPAEELAARALGASPLEAFVRVTLPGLRLPLVQAAIGALARALGELGSVAVVSGHIRGETMTVPLVIEALDGEYDGPGAFVLAALLALVALAAVGVKKFLEAALRPVPAAHQVGSP